jgi:hypothetical protein
MRGRSATAAIRAASTRVAFDLSLGKSKTLNTLGRVREEMAARMSFDSNYVFIVRCQRVSGKSP